MLKKIKYSDDTTQYDMGKRNACVHIIDKIEQLIKNSKDEEGDFHKGRIFGLEEIKAFIES